MTIISIDNIDYNQYNILGYESQSSLVSRCWHRFMCFTYFNIVYLSHVVFLKSSDPLHKCYIVDNSPPGFGWMVSHILLTNSMQLVILSVLHKVIDPKSFKFKGVSYDCRDNAYLFCHRFCGCSLF